MPKYYIVSGELRRIVDAESPKQAAWYALLRAKGEEIDRFFRIDERGFRNNILPTWVIPYNEIVKE
jgi:hypothetical protein